MKDLCPTQSETINMLSRLRENGSEIPSIDCKETLNLKTAGDHASFIRHIAALANTGERSCLFIGVEDKTWLLKGISDDSPLRSTDSTQQQMNQILTKRVDPRIVVGYRTYEINGTLLGVVGLEGTNAPYVVSVDGSKYGGAKTQGGQSYVYSGVIYTRRGADSIPISRQSELLAILNSKRDYVEIGVNLVFIGILVAIGVGISASLITFGDIYVAGLLGSVLGIVIGWMLNKRLTDAYGRFPNGLLGKLMKSSSGSLWGGAMGLFLSCWIVNAILSGTVESPNPIIVGLFATPLLSILCTLSVIACAIFARGVVSLFGKVK